MYLFFSLHVHLLFSISYMETPMQKSSEFCSLFQVEVFPLQTLISCVEISSTVDTLWCSPSPICSSKSVSTQRSPCLCACMESFFPPMNKTWSATYYPFPSSSHMAYTITNYCSIIVYNNCTHGIVGYKVMYYHCYQYFFSIKIIYIII